MYRSDVLTVKDLRRTLEKLRDDALVTIEVNGNSGALAFSSCEVDRNLVIEAVVEGLEEDPETDPCLGDEERDARRDGVCVRLKE